jgi:short-subunit dehydrogenase
MREQVMKADKTLKENVVVITGASAGIGRALALLLAEQGAWLALAARDEKRLKALAVECEQRGGRALVVPTDVAVEEQCQTLILRTVENYGRIDTLINNAGLSMWAPFDKITDLSMVEKIMRVNYLGSVYPTFYALPFLKKSRGRIVALSSLTGKVGVPTRSAYAASKHAIAGFFDSLRIELADTGVTVTVLYPGFVATEVRQRALGADGLPLGDSHIDESRVMSAEECARVIVDAVRKRQREVVFTAKAKIGLWLKLVAPALVDSISRKSISTGR